MLDKPKYGCPITYKNEQALNKEISQHTSFLTLACKVEYLSIDNSAMTNYKTYLRIKVKNESKRVYLQLFRQRLSHKSVEAYATMPTSIMGSKR